MPIINRAVQTKRRERVAELIAQGHTNKQISQRVQVGERTVLRIRKKMQAGDACVHSR